MRPKCASPPEKGEHARGTREKLPEVNSKMVRLLCAPGPVWQQLWLAAAAVAVASSNLCPHPPPPHPHHSIGVVVVVGDPALTLHIINQSARRQSAIRQTLRMRARGVKGLCDENTATQYWHDRLFGWPGFGIRTQVVCVCFLLLAQKFRDKHNYVLEFLKKWKKLVIFGLAKLIQDRIIVYSLICIQQYTCM